MLRAVLKVRKHCPLTPALSPDFVRGEGAHLVLRAVVEVRSPAP